MRIIDGKGRLFGKINVIDFLVIIFLLGLTPIFYFGYKIFIKKPSVVSSPAAVVAEQKVIAPKKDMIELELVFDLIKLSPDTAKLISVGDKEIDRDGQVIGEIINLKKLGPYEHEFEIGNGLKLFKEDYVFKHVLATMRIKAELRQNNIYYKDEQIVKNGAIDFVTDKYKIEAVYLPQVIDKIKDVSLSIDQRIRLIRDEIEKRRQEIIFLKNLQSKVRDIRDKK